ncbi:hypothetical protein TWF730_009047 [Orbilia blumenaviensis]|uniref:Uncharacterized protein n=1 Tax=Orbilia blumenaviensis TaxID=1796055 RepID=A0AAV9UZY5_9PEZI
MTPIINTLRRAYARAIPRRRVKPPQNTRNVRILQGNRSLISRIQEKLSVPQVIAQSIASLTIYELLWASRDGYLYSKIKENFDMLAQTWDEEFEKARVEWMLKDIDKVQSDHDIIRDGVNIDDKSERKE